MRKILLLFFVLLCTAFSNEFPACGKISSWSIGDGAYKCEDWGPTSSNKQIKMPKAVKRLIYTDCTNFPPWGEVDSPVCCYALYEVPYKNGIIDGVAQRNYNALDCTTRESSAFFFQDDRIKYDNPYYKFYRTPVNIKWEYSNGIAKSEQGFDPSGNLEWDVKLSNGEKEGLYRSYYDTGELKSQAEYHKGKIVNEEIFYNTDGSINYKNVYKNGEFFEKKCTDGRRGNPALRC